ARRRVVDLDRRRRALGALRAHGCDHRGRAEDPDGGENGGPNMSDPRIEAYAKLLVEDCLDVQPGWQVLVSAGMLARPLIEEVSRQRARRGAYAIQRLNLAGSGINLPWAREAPEELTDEPAALQTVAHAE